MGLYFLCGHGGNRTHMAEGHTILSRARLPIPPHALLGYMRYFKLN